MTTKEEFIEIVSEMCHEMNRTYCRSMGDMSQPRWADAPEWQKESARLGVGMVVENPDSTPEDSHKSWMKQKKADGWKFGPSKDPMRKEHPCMVSYHKLPKSQQIKDLIFVTTIKTMMQDVEFHTSN